MKYMYILLLSISFSNYIVGIQVPYLIKYVLAIIISVIGLFPVINKTNKIQGIEYFGLKNYIKPIIYIFIWSIIIWGVNEPVGFNTSNITRMISNCMNLILSVTTAISVIRLFGKKAIKYSVIAIVISIVFNMICCIKVYGMGLFFQYITQAIFSTDFTYGSDLYNLGVGLEVQDATLAIGFYILYFIFFAQEYPKKSKIKYLILLLLCSYIGFKRTQFISIILTSIVLILMKKFKEKDIIILIGTVFTIVCFIYVVVIKLDLFANIVNYFGANVTGRTTIYTWLSKYYDLSILYIGKGFTFVDKNMFETTGFASHNSIVRMYAELGCIPFFIWSTWYLIRVPLNVLKKYSKQSALTTFACILYLFFTYFIGNSINFFCIQYSFILIQAVSIFEELENRKKDELQGGKNEDCNFINAKSL